MVNMTVSTIGGRTPYTEYGTDFEKTKAKKFAQANDKSIGRLAQATTYNPKKEKEFAGKVSTAIMSLPLVAGIGAAITAKGEQVTRGTNGQFIKPYNKPIGLSQKLAKGGKAALATAGIMGIATAVVVANEKIAQKSPKIEKAEKKHPLLTMAGLVGAATATTAMIGKGIDKISPKAGEKLAELGKKVKIEKFTETIDRIPEATKGIYNKVASKVSLPKGLKENMNKIGAKVKVPDGLKDTMKKAKNSELAQHAIKTTKKLGNSMLNNPVTTACVLIGAALIGHSMKRADEVKQTKADLKEAQQKTANTLIDAYALENDSLKSANAKAALDLEEAQQVIVEDVTEVE